MAKRKKFGEVLVDEGVINEKTLQSALAQQTGTGKRLGQILEEQKVISERDIALVLARQFGLKTVKNIADHNFPDKILDLVDSEKALQKLIFPLKVEDRTLYLAMVNPLDMETLDTLSFGTGLRIVPYLTTTQEIHAAINKHYMKSIQVPTEGKWWRIMVVDHQLPTLVAAVSALSQEGFDVVQCGNAIEAVPMAVQAHPHLIITEANMPKISGTDLFNSLKKNPQTASIPVIALSGRATAKEEAQLLDMGFIDFIAKPINAIRLSARIKRVLKLLYEDLSAPPTRRR